MGELAATANVSKRTIDYYTNLGLLHPERTKTNYRIYDENALRVLKLINYYKKLHMPLDEIKKIIGAKISTNAIDGDRVKQQARQLADMMEFLELEVQDIASKLDKLDHSQREIVLKHILPHTAALSQSILVLLG
ncbi:MerR family transcriptional regulator [Virgibacillus sp. LDC-1]|uniref:MerR family transcriptional regulator n=1 Tax=Virgibacillus sp. LDC-1 TaxID=3039856 RepID=UPI0024DE386B|nr:MerR family transcriptional regulator [Virgibacillus sp. LDC-1]